ncbi:MAG TPA: tetratricopeptide repeat protein, partial [Phycisphaerales bacterium]|nr:tetratricopeptide repeat protein [Phycisphaerales bacterium]
RGNQSEAQSIIAQELEQHPDDLRLIVAMANVLVRAGQFEQAKTYIDRGLSIEPENRSLLGLQTAAAIGNDPEAALEHIAELDVPELDKQLKRFRVYQAAGDFEGAAAALEAARNIDPSDKRVVIASFDEALRNEDYDLAERIYNENANRDIDGANGLAMRARVELARGKIDEAERTLEAAVERGSTNPVTLRLLAQVQYQLGDVFNALENYKQAIALRPNDIDLTKGYLVTLMQLNRLEEALNTARTAAPIGQHDPEFREIWLTLEGLVGDKQMAYDQRRELAETEPDNAGNTANLIRLAMDLRNFDEARRMLDEARAKQDSLALAILDAEWHAGRNDLQSAAQVFSDFISSDANDPDDPSAYIALGQFFIKYGAIDNGLRTLRQAVDLQDPDRPIADATIADQLFRMQRYAEAIPHLESMIEHNYQVQHARRRLIEALVRSGELERAAQEIASLDEAEQHSLQILLLNSDIARLSGNDAESLQLIDEAVSKFPDDPLAYMKRATRLMTNPATLPDALEDLTRAIELNPANSEALRFRSMVLAELGRTDEAAEDVAAAAAARPDDTRLQLQAVQRLIDLDRASDATALVDKLLTQQASNLTLMLGAGDIFTRAGKPQSALTYFSQAWEQSKTVAVAQRLVDALLNASRPDVRRARQVAESPDIADSSNPAVLLLRAKVEAADKRPSAVTQLLDSTYELVKNDPNMLAVMFNQLEDLLGSPDAALGYLERVEQERSLTAWGSIFRAQLMLAEPSEREAGLRLLSQTIDSTDDPSVKFAGYKIRAGAEYADGDYEAAATDMLHGLELFPDDADLNNNLAYTLARHLNRASEALPYARKAVQLTPNSKNTLDTLGLVLSETGQNEEALKTLRRALSLGQTDADKALVLIHIAEAQFRSGNIQDAEETAQQARRIMAGRVDDFTDESRQELDAILAKIENAK